MFGALSGFEYVAIFAGEARSPARNLTRSVLITAPFIALIYIFARVQSWRFVSPEAVDVVGPIPQALRLGSRAFGLSGFIVPFAIVLLFVNYPTSFSVYFSASTRLPMVAGWDICCLNGLLGCMQIQDSSQLDSFPGSRHPDRKRGCTDRVGSQEAYELLLTWGFTFYAIAYLGAVRHTVSVAQGARLAPGIMAAGCGHLGILNDAALHRTLSFSHHRRGELVEIFIENRCCRSGSKCSRLGSLSRGARRQNR